MLGRKKRRNIKKFYIEGDGAVMDVGLRINVIGRASDYNVLARPKNMIDENKVEILVAGCQIDIGEFWDAVRTMDLRTIKKGNGYKVTKLEKYDGCEPDWEYSNLALNLEQTTKGIVYLKSIDEKLDELPQKIADALSNNSDKS